MTGWTGAVVTVLAAGAVAAVVVAVREWLVARCRQRVRAAVEQEAARRICQLVPTQRTDEPSWWEFVPRQRDGGEPL